MHDLDQTVQAGFGNMESFEYPGTGQVFSESEVEQLAGEAMGITSEAEMEQFLGDLISKASRAIGSFVKSPVGKALGGVLKSAAKQLLPMAGQALGNYFNNPALGSQLASAAGSAFGLNEAEMEEAEYEGAQTLVRLAGDAVKNAASAPPDAHPQAVANAAVQQAAQIHAPGLVAPPMLPRLGGTAGRPEGAGLGRARSGRWIRRGGKIILLGA
jgi:hypothetical protein